MAARRDRAERGQTRRRATRLVASVIGVASLMLVVPGGSTVSGATGSAPSVRPTVPLAVTVTPGPGPGELTVAWSAPSYTGEFINMHSVAVAYGITDYDLKGVPARSWASCNDLLMTCTATGLRSTRTYQVSVVVWNTKGKHSPPSVPVAATPPA